MAEVSIKQIMKWGKWQWQKTECAADAFMLIMTAVQTINGIALTIKSICAQMNIAGNFSRNIRVNYLTVDETFYLYQ